MVDQNKCVIIVPIYKNELDYDEYNSLKQLFKILDNYDIIAICPMSLDVYYYNINFKFKDYYRFYDEYFETYPKGYNKLMLTSGFYRFFESYKYMLIYQHDCWVFRDELEYWCDKDYDYIGAPFLFVNQYRTWLNIDPGVHIGNGGFSLRKISYWIDFCERYKESAEQLYNENNTDWGEDHIILDLLSHNIDINIKLPSFYEASLFSFDTDAYILYQMNGHKLPFGCHAYKKISCNDFWDEFIIYDNEKTYSVVTFLFGDYDILRDPVEVDPCAEYICITDRDDLKSNVWKFKHLNFPNIERYNSWQKSMIARYTALDYINTNICLKIDASVHIKKSPRKYINLLNLQRNIEAMYMLHPWRTSFMDEYNAWINERGLDPIQKEQFIEYCENNSYDYNLEGMIMTTIMIQRNNTYNQDLNKYVLNELMNNNEFNQRVDQTYFTIIFTHKFWYSDVMVHMLSMQVLDSEYFDYYYHGTNYTHSGEYKYDLSKEDYKMLINRKYKCLYFA